MYRFAKHRFSNASRRISFGGRLLVYTAIFAVCVTFISACSTSARTAFEPAEQDPARAARNRAAILSALDGIEKYRKGNVEIWVVSSNGKPAPNARLEIKQVSHAFKFGCYLKIDDLEPKKLPEYERRFAALFNYAVIGTYWDAMESRRGDENWTWFDRESEMARKMGLAIQAAPILWGTNKYGTPAWLPRDTAELSSTIQQRVKTVISRNESIGDHEIVNEPLAPHKDVFAAMGTEEYIRTAFRSANEAGPNKRHLINEYGVFGSVAKHNYNRDRYFELLQRLIANDVPIDIIGIQAHANGEWYEPANVAEQLERYATLGKPIQITEFSAPTADLNDRRQPMPISGTYRAGVWDAEKQAEFYREFYTVAFGDPHVDAIVSWGLDDERAWLPGIGLIGKDGEPKPAYRELDDLVNKEWKTAVTGRSNADGKYDLRGFYGKYTVTVIGSNGKAETAEFSLDANGPKTWTVQLSN